MHITPFGEKKVPLDYFVTISMTQCLVANKMFVSYYICFV